MSDDPAKALGHRRFDFGSLDPLDFEELCFSLVRLDFPEVARLAAPDGGLDCIDRSGDGAARGWQAKRFTGSISWPQCEDSLQRAVARYEPGRVTFCFARDLTEGQLRNFDRRLVGPYPSVQVDWWGASQLSARLSTADGRLVARRFFGDPEWDSENVARAIRSGGQLRDLRDVVDRQQALGEFIAGLDPYFAYESSAREAGATAAQPARGTAVSLEHIRDGVSTRIDVRPRTSDALRRHGPKGRLVFSDDEQGAHAAAEIERIRAVGGTAKLEAGLSVAFDRMPAGLTTFAEALAQPRPAKVTVTATRVSWDVRVTATSDLGTAEMPMTLTGVRASRVVIKGRHGGLTLRVTFGEDGTLAGGIDWTYTQDRSPAAEQVAALRFLQLVGGGATVRLVATTDATELVVATSRPEPPDEWVDGQHLIFDTLIRLESANGIRFDIPEEFPEQEAVTIMQVGDMLRSGGAAATWERFDLVVRPEGLANLTSGKPLRMTEEAYARILGEEVHIGRRELDVVDYRIVDTAPAGPEGGDLKVSFAPAGGTRAPIWMSLVAEAPDAA